MCGRDCEKIRYPFREALLGHDWAYVLPLPSTVSSRPCESSLPPSPTEPVTCVSFSRDGHCTLVSSLDNKLRLLDKDNGELLNE